MQKPGEMTMPAATGVERGHGGWTQPREGWRLKTAVSATYSPAFLPRHVRRDLTHCLSLTGTKNIAVQDGKHSTTKRSMDNIDPRVFSRSKGSNTYPALVRPNHRARTLLFAVVVAVTAGIPMAAGLYDPGHVLSTSICPGALAGPAPASNSSNFDWQSVS